MATERLKVDGHRFGGIFALLDWLLTAGITPFAPRQYLYRTVNEDGSGNLTVVSRHFWQERVHRYDFRDIQAISMVRTHWCPPLLGLTFLSAIVVYSAVEAIALLTKYPGWFDLFSEGLAFEIATIVGLALTAVGHGPVSACDLYTSVGKERLYCLSRWRKAKPIVDQLRADIERAQELAGFVAGETAPRVSEAFLSRADARRLANRPVPTDTWHLLFFLFLAYTVVSSAFDLFLQSDWKNALDTVVFVLSVIVGALALARQNFDRAGITRAFPKLLRNATIGGLASLYVTFITFQAFVMGETMSMAMRDPMNPPTHVEPGPVAIVAVSILNILLFTPLSLAGFRGIVKMRRQQPPTKDA